MLNDEMLVEIDEVVSLNFSTALYLRFNTAKLKDIFDLLSQGAEVVKAKLKTYNI